jgi:hypothetical protein
MVRLAGRTSPRAGAEQDHALDAAAARFKQFLGKDAICQVVSGHIKIKYGFQVCRMA